MLPALRHAPRLIGVHLNYIPGSYRPYLEAGAQLAPAEEAFLREAARWADESGAYWHLQRTRPQTAAFGLNDSPAGLAAWILEKFREWSDCDGEVLRRFSRDELLANVTLYWMTETIASSFRLYLEGRKAPLQFQAGGRARVQRAPLDQHAARRPLRRGRGAGAAGGRPSGVLSAAARLEVRTTHRRGLVAHLGGSAPGRDPPPVVTRLRS